MDNHKIKDIKLKNGSRLVHVSIPNLPFSIVSTWFQVGSRNDPKGKEGLAHFFEHLLGTKTPKHKNKISRLKLLESKGIEFNAFTYFDTTHYYHIQLPRDTAESLSLLIDGLQKGIISQKDVDRERGVILDEESRNKNDPQSYLWRLKNQSLWPKSLLGRDFYGTKESIKSINIGDINNFRAKYYNFNNAVFLIIGDVNIKDCIKLLNKIDNKKSQLPLLIDTEDFISPKSLFKKQINADQQFVGIYYRTAPFIKDGIEKCSIDLLRQYLSNTWVSKLIEKLRILNNYTYWVDGSNGFFVDTGFIGFEFSVQKQNLDNSLSLVKKEIERIKDKGPSRNDLMIIKRSYISWLIKHTSTDAQELLWWYGRYAVFDRPIITVFDYIKKIDEINVRSLKDVAKKYLVNENNSVILLGKD